MFPRSLNIFAVSFALAALLGCDQSPGPLEGTWKSEGIVPMTISFRPGETESMGIIEHVDYKVDGSVVTVQYKDGLMKGTAIRLAVVDKNTAKGSTLTLKRVN